MKKTIFFALIATAVLAGCTRVETLETPADKQYAIDFGAYSGRVQTKAGPTEDMNLDALKKHGFGVFATYSGTENFGTANDNFMRNEKVAYSEAAGAWTYSPIRYWPNPTGGQAETAQKVSFFAYAPYCSPTTVETSGITGFGIDATTGHNIVNYTFNPGIVDATSGTVTAVPNVDLMWGYQTGSTTQANLNLTRTASTVKFTFRHLLSKLGGSQEGAITDPDASGYQANGLIIKASPTADPTNIYSTGATGDFGSDTGTKITVSSIIVASAPETDAISGAAVKDALGNNVVYATAAQTGKLDLYTGVFSLDAAPKPVIFRQEIKTNPTDAEREAGVSELADRLKEPGTVTSFAALPVGVTETSVNVYKDENNPLILIPDTAPVVDVTVTYVVRTYDEKLPKGYTEVPQTVFGRVKFPIIEQNKKYNLCIIVGLNDVKFEASVQDWTLGGTWVDADGDGVVDEGEVTGTSQDVWLPSNL